MEREFQQQHHSFESKCYDWFVCTLGASASLAAEMPANDAAELECPLIGRFS
jgi:hypothetical protein